MKKKTIEKIPFLTLPKVSMKKTVEYIGVTAIEDIGGQRHLFIEVYRNDKENTEVPVVRIVLNKNDFGTYFPESGIWTKEKIASNTWDSRGLIWREDERKRMSMKVLEESNILRSSDDLKRIRTFTDIPYGMETEDKKRAWWCYIEEEQKDIARRKNINRRMRQQERRQQMLRERKDHTPELPEQKIIKYAEDHIFGHLHYLYYKKHGVRAALACSKCGGVMTARWKAGISYENKFERMIEEPRNGVLGTCPMCGVKGIYMPQGKAKSSHIKTCRLFLGQRYKENGMVFRYIEVGKEWQLELTFGEKGDEMYSASEKIDGVEIARAYFEPGKKIQMDFHKHDPWSGRDFWDDCNLSGIGNIAMKEGRIMPETYEEMKGTFLQYSALQRFQRAAGDVNPVDYLERYLQTPQIEMLVKMGLIDIVQQLVMCHYGIVADGNANRVEAFLGIRKERVKQLIEHEGDIQLLETMQIEKRLGMKWTDEQVEHLTEIGMDSRQAALAMEHMTAQKLLNKISKYAGCEYGTMCGTAIGRLRQTAQIYFDYLRMRQDLGYDLDNTVYLFPRDLWAAHDRMVQEHNKIKAEKRLQEIAEKYPLIKKQYRRLLKKFYYEDEDYLIRPARSAEEIVMEGRILHHCVGGNYYLSRHNDMQSIILFLRYRDKPKAPYITVEIDTSSLEIRQWYGANDKKVDKENMERWLNNYVTRLRCREPEQGVRIQIQAYA